MEATNTIAEQIKTLLSNLREDVAKHTADLESAKIALRDALASFKPQPLGRPPKAKRVKKAKAAEASHDDVKE